MLYTLENGRDVSENSAHRELNASIAWHIKRRKSVQLSEKHREKSVFDKRECDASLVDLRSEFEVTDGGGKVSSSIDV